MFSAGEVEKFGYCPLTWWLSREAAEEKGEEIAEGITKHEQLGDEILSIERHEKHVIESETTVLYFAIAATIVAVLGVSFVSATTFPVTLILDAVSLIWLLAAVFLLYRADRLSSEAEHFLWGRVILGFAMVATIVAIVSVATFVVRDSVLGRAAEIAALVWLIGASFFLRRSIVHGAIARAAREKFGATRGEVAYVDHPQTRPELFVSERYGLRGRPDYVIAEGDHLIPVEVKTGRTPRGPLFSHILQVGAYCLLVEEKTGKPPPHGIIKYEGASHEIEYNDDMRRLVVGKLDAMRAALAKGEAHRNHQRPGKCIHCSRREGCPERLA